MKNSEQRLKTKEYWQTKIRDAENFSGPEIEFCRQEGLNNATLVSVHRILKNTHKYLRGAANRLVNQSK